MPDFKRNHGSWWYKILDSLIRNLNEEESQVKVVQPAAILTPFIPTSGLFCGFLIRSNYWFHKGEIWIGHFLSLSYS
jgi:hypothetical protein